MEKLVCSQETLRFKRLLLSAIAVRSEYWLHLQSGYGPTAYIRIFKKHCKTPFDLQK